MPGSTPWNLGQDALLKAHYGKKPVELLARWCRRSVNAVRKHAQELGLRVPEAWTPAMNQLLGRLWGKVPTRELARRFGRTAGAVKQHAMKLLLDSGRYYTDAEKDLVRELYATHTAAQIAERIHGTGRAAKAVYRLAWKLGLQKCPHHGDGVYDRVRELHGQGLPDRVIAQRTGLSASQVKHVRRDTLGLPLIPDLEGRRLSVESQRRSLGIRHGGDLRALAYRRFAVENGWPEDLRPREVQILNVLAARGVPMTKPELAAAIGVATTKTFASGKRRVLLAGNGPGGTYTASLLRRGMLLRLKRASQVIGRGSGRSMDLYTLGPEALAILERRAACQTTGNATR